MKAGTVDPQKNRKNNRKNTGGDSTAPANEFAVNDATVQDKSFGVDIIDDDGEILSDKKPKKKMKKWKKILIIALSFILGLILALGAVFLIFRTTGKKSLYGNATYEKPNLNTAERESEDANNSDMLGEVDAGSDEADDIIVIENTAGSGNGNGGTGGSNGSGIQENADSDISFEGAGGDSGYDVIHKGQKYAYNKDMITMLFLGIDKYGEVEPAEDGVSGGQADALFLLIMNPHTKVMDILAIHRNSIGLVDIYDKDNNFKGSGYTQICLQHAYGGGMENSNEMTKKAVSRMLYNLPIHAVTSINMGAVPELNDAVGGITLNAMETFSADGYDFTSGENVTLNGKAAYTYIHYRNKYISDSAGMRLNRQKQYMTQYVNKAMAEIKQNVGKVVDVYNIVNRYVITDLSIDEMTYLASEAVGYSFGGIYSFSGSLDPDPKWKYERYNLDRKALYEMLINKFYEKVN